MPIQLEQKRFEKKLQEVQKQEHLPAKLTAMASAIICLQRDAMPKAALIAKSLLAQLDVSENSTSDKGNVLLPRAHFPVDFSFIAELFTAALLLLTKKDVASDTLANAAKELHALMEQGEFSLAEAVQALLIEDATFFAAWEKRFEHTPQLVRFVSSVALTPLAIAVGELVNVQRARENEIPMWHQGSCPVCGSLPFISVLEQNEGHRFSCCSFCRLSYRVPRLQCSFCLDEIPDATQVYNIEEEPGFLVQSCDNCKNYSKIIDFRALDRVCIPALDDILSLAFDVKAQRMGYAHPVHSIWGL